MLHFDLIQELPADRKRRWTALGCSSLLQPASVALTVWFLAAPPQMIHREKRDYSYFQVVLPPPPGPHISTAQKPARVLHPRNPQVVAEPRRPVPLPAIARTVPVSDPPKLLPPPAPGPPAPKLSEAPKPEVPAVRTDVFSGSSARATLKRAARQVQTGGFGDVNGFPGDALGDSRGNVAKLGSFDLPIGPGYGNGSGGSHGVRGTVSSVGFGNGIASAGGEGGPGRGSVRESGFGDLNSVPQTAAKRPLAAEGPEIEPVEILSKPNPVYTEEARRLHVQGEVLLEVVFQASGELRVMRVVRGLGHGLDEAALRAAEQILFKPARRGAQAVDSRATLHIVFQLAY